jgi:hypothetical protein
LYFCTSSDLGFFFFRKHFEKANAIVKGLSKDKKPKKPKKVNHNQQHQIPIDETLDSIDYMGSSGYERGYLRDRGKTKGRQNLSANSVLGQRRASKKEDESESEESDLSDEEEEEEGEEEEEEEDEDESEGEEMILELKNHDKQSPRGQWSRPDKLPQKPNGKGRGGRGGGRGRKAFEDLLNGDSSSLSKNPSEGTLEYVRNELRTLRADLELKERSGDSVLSQLRLEVLSQLQGARINAEVSLGALKIEIDNDLSSKKDECMRQLYSISSQMEIIKSLFLSDRKILEEQPGTASLPPPSPSPSPSPSTSISTSTTTTKSTALSQVERILSIIDSRFSRRVEVVKKIWDQNDGETGVEGVRKVVADDLLKTEKEMCENLQETKGTIKGEYDDIRHRITIIEQCLQHGLLDLDVSKRCADSLSLKAIVLGGGGHVALPSPSSLPSPLRESASTSNGTHSPSVPSPSSPLVSSSSAFVSAPTPTPPPATATPAPSPISTPSSYSSSTPTTTTTYSAPAILLMAATNAN